MSNEDSQTALEALLKSLRSSLRYVYRMSLARYQPHRRLKLGIPSRETPFFLSSVIRVKNEARFLPELLAHHYSLGVEHFYLYDNNSTDDIRGVLRPFFERGLVTVIEWPTIPASPGCYQHFFTHFAADSRWVAFLDADEFLIESEEGEIVRFLKTHASWPAIAINWKYFGSSFHQTIPEGLVMSNFTSCDAQMSSHFKVIARPDKIISYYNSHNFIYKFLDVARDTDGRPALGSVLSKFRTQPSNIWLHHYVYRSRQDYLTKVNAGYVDAEGYKFRARRMALAEAEFHRHNAVTDTTAFERFSARVFEFLRELGYGSPYVSADPGLPILVPPARNVQEPSNRSGALRSVRNAAWWFKVKRSVNKLLNAMGLEVHQISGAQRRARTSIAESYALLKDLGFRPNVVIDVGVAYGTPELYENFPDAYLLLAEPLPKFEPSLKAILKRYRGCYVLAAMGARSGRSAFNVHDNHLEGSSLYKETMGPAADGTEITVPIRRLDEVLVEKALSGPYLLKVDVQGAELDVLDGGQAALRESEVVVLEVSMFEFGKGQPQFFDVASYMKERGFVAFDIVIGWNRPLDNALGQVDIVFVKEHGQFRQDHAYARTLASPLTAAEAAH